jgi:hypothetical protein
MKMGVSGVRRFYQHLEVGFFFFFLLSFFALADQLKVGAQSEVTVA